MPNGPEFTRHYDAIVIGARCAGAATALLLARGGARVLMVDWDQPGTDTLSTHALMRGAVMQLGAWGLLDAVIGAGTPPVRSTHFRYGDTPVDVAIKPSHGVDALYAPRRTLLDRILVEAAVAAGVEARFGVGLADLVRDASGRVTGALLDVGGAAMVSVAARHVIGADGRRSLTARRAGAATLRQARHATATVYSYVSGLESSGYGWYYREGLAAGLIPTNGGRHCIFTAMPRARFVAEARGRLEAALRTIAAEVSPELGALLADANLDARPVGFAGQPGHLRQASGPGWALVGDAGYFKDPLTAHGITDALRDAEVLARALLAGSDAALAGYQEQRDAMSVELFEVTDAIASFDWSLDDLMALHRRLNKAMKAEQDWMAAAFAGLASAA